MTQTPAVLRRCVATAAGLWLLGTSLAAQAPTAAQLYQKAVDRETTLRATATPAAEDVDRTIAAYEQVVRRYPNSGYADNALWQASGVALMGARQLHRDSDRAAAERLLKWLREYPSSPFVKQIDERLQSFDAAPAAPVVARTASGPTPASPVTPAAVPPTAPVMRAPAAVKGAPATLRAITRESLPRGERIILEVDREVAYVTDRIAGPDRVFLDLGATGVGDGVPAAAAAVKGQLVTTVRLGHPTAGTTRIVMHLAGAPKHSIYPLYNPYRLVIDTEGTPPPPITKTVVAEPLLNAPVLAELPAAPPTPSVSVPVPSGAAMTPPAPPTPKPATPTTEVKPDVKSVPPPSPMAKGDYSLARQLGLGVQRIVIDAGHGGHDPGAQGNGLVEKDLVLDVALRLKALLQQQPGFDVVLTRDCDEFIPLEERTAIANRAGADLFLSIHANASTQQNARGLETYFLNFATNVDAEKVAARENAASAQSMGRLPEILKTIALNTKVAESRELATMVQTAMVRKMKTQNAAVRDLGVKQAPFVVLIGAEMPSILAEISFVTNRTDAASLKQSATRDKIAQALLDGIVKYQSSLKRASAVGPKTEKR